MVILPARVLVPVTVKIDVFTELVIAAFDVMVSEVMATVPAYCRSSVPPEAIETGLEPKASALLIVSVPALMLVPPP